MPLYEYKCTGLEEHTFERRAGYDDDEVRCPIVIEMVPYEPIEEPQRCEAPAHRQIPTKDSNIGIIIR